VKRLLSPFFASALALLGGLTALAASPGADGANRLAGHPSPYLALHAADPVDWQPWGAEVLARARREGRLVFVSSGYFACHWCHVMQRESFRDPEVADYLNRHFVPVKVDRELLPALDAELIRFVGRTGGRAGWPLTVLLTPDGHPLFGTAYLPRDELLQALRRIEGRWATDRTALAALAEAGARELGTPPPPPALAPGEAARMVSSLAAEALAAGDELAGGFGQESKFPASPQLLALLEVQRRQPDPALGRFLRLTLDQMAALGLRDHLGGGFFRYTTDPGWQTPHFEKMLSDNALLARVYLRASEVLGDPRYAEVARDTLDFLLREMADPGGGFVASLSAVDGAGEEGGYYLWTDAEIRGVLAADERAAVGLAWGLAGPGPFAGAHLPIAALEPFEVARRLDEPAEVVTARLATAREELQAARAHRTLPRDPKLVAAWNGLALEALARASSLPGGEAYRAAGARLARRLARDLWSGQGLARALAGGRAFGDAGLEDYAYVASGLLAWAEAADDAGSRALAGRVAREGWRRFRGAGGWRLGEAGAVPFAGEEPVLPDGATPSPSAVLLGVSLTLPDPDLARRAREALGLRYPELAATPLRHATHIALLRAGGGRGGP
jgi:hypothetical protein